MHKNGATIFRESIVACLTAKQQGLVFTIAGTGRYVPFSPDSMLRTLWIRTKIIAKIHPHALLSAANTEKVGAMGVRANQLIAQYSNDTVVRGCIEAVRYVVNKNRLRTNRSDISDAS